MKTSIFSAGGHGRPSRGSRNRTISSLVMAAAAVLGISVSGTAAAKGGTAKPPVRGAVAPLPLQTPNLPDPIFSVSPTLIRGFDVTGFIYDMTVSDAACPGSLNPGGTVTVNGITITVPCNTIMQMPANTLSWSEFVNGDGTTLPPSLTLASGTAYPSFEISVVGNLVDKTPIAGLIFVSQQSLNGASGFISRIDYATGNIEVENGLTGLPVVLQINDPNGRFGRAQSPDFRFSVDDGNPTIHAATGYPMCVPRTDPATADDPLCPQVNRPKAASGCRNFSQATVPPPVSGELTPPAVGQVYCSQYVMKSVNDPTRTALDADPRQQAPFEVGDFITWSGTLMKDLAGVPFISAHTIEANIGIYTQPGTQPSYLAIGEFGVGTADPAVTAVNGAAVETQDRIFLEAETTDVKTPVDIYYVAVDPVTGAEHNRWVTPWEMTGECDPLVLPMPANCFGTSGGITTQNTGPQPQRARIRAVKAPTLLLSQPTRNVRVAVRSLCNPSTGSDATGTPILNANLDTCLAGAPVVANGLLAGQYAAPVFEYIFPENVRPGDLVVPYDFWHLPFLRSGDGAGPLVPTPW